MKAKRRKDKAASPAPEEAPEGATAAANGAPYTVDDLLARAESLLDAVELEAAQQFCLRALEMEASNVRALELCGLLLLESGANREAEARFCFERVAQLAPQPHHSVLLYLAQLSEGAEAVAHTERALQLMRQHLEAPPAAEAAPSARHKAPTWRDVSNAHCAIAELFMTDLCDTGEAEVRCGGAIEAAVAADGANPEALHLQASFHLVKGNVTDAKTVMSTAVQLWLPALRAAMDKGEQEGEGAEEEATGGGGDVAEATGLSFESRLKAAQTLLELEMLEEAADVLESLQAEDDEDLQVLYLSCIVHFKLWERQKGGEEREEAEEEEAEAAANARAFLQGGLELLKGCGQKEMEEHLQEMLQALGDAGKEEGEGEIPESSGEEEEEMDQN